MSRFAFFLTSLVAAIPALGLSAVLVLAFFSYSGNMNIMAIILAAVTLFFSGVTTVTPFFLLVFGGSKQKRTAPKADGAKAAGGIAEAEESGDDQSIVSLDSIATAEAFGDEVENADSAYEELSTQQSLVEVEEFGSGDELEISADSDLELDDTTSFETPIANSAEELSLSDLEVSDIDDEFSVDEFEIADDFSGEVILEDEDDEPKPKSKKKRK